MAFYSDLHCVKNFRLRLPLPAVFIGHNHSTGMCAVSKCIVFYPFAASINLTSTMYCNTYSTCAICFVCHTKTDVFKSEKDDEV